MDRESSLVMGICLLAGLLALSGCYEPEPAPQIIGEVPPLVLPAPEPPPAKRYLVGRSVQGRALVVQTVGEGAETVFVMAGIHGNEPAGTPLVNSLTEHLRRNRQLLEGRRIVLLPVANPDGLAARTRENIRRIDLNRNFEAVNRVDNESNGLRPLSEPESRALATIIKQYRPGRIVTVHQPLSCIDYDGPGQTIAARIAQYCDLPVKKLGAQPGSLGAYAGETLGIPTITIELPAEASRLREEALWQQYGAALLAAILYPEHPRRDDRS